MARARIPYGRTYYLTASFVNPTTGLPYSPGTVTFRLLPPNGVLQTFTLSTGVTSIGGGVYRITFVANQAGLWRYAIEGKDASFEAVLDPPGEIIVDALGVE